MGTGLRTNTRAMESDNVAATRAPFNGQLKAQPGATVMLPARTAPPRSTWHCCDAPEAARSTYNPSDLWLCLSCYLLLSFRYPSQLCESHERCLQARDKCRIIQQGLVKDPRQMGSHLAPPTVVCAPCDQRRSLHQVRNWCTPLPGHPQYQRDQSCRLFEKGLQTKASHRLHLGRQCRCLA